MFKSSQDKARNDKKSKQENPGQHLTGLGQDLLLGGTKQDIDSAFSPKSWTNKPKDKQNKQNKKGK